MTSRLPLSALLSQTLIAFTLDFDRELAARCRIAGAPASAATLAMWSNVMRFLGDERVDERRLPGLSGVPKATIHSMVACLDRHGWITVQTTPAAARTRLIGLAPKGRDLQPAWRPLLDLIEQRWNGRYGEDGTSHLRSSLAAVVSQLDAELPYYPMFSAVVALNIASNPRPGEVGRSFEIPLSALLSQVLIAFTVEFERLMAIKTNGSHQFLPGYANVMRLLREEGLPIRHLRAQSGVSGPAMRILAKLLEKYGWTVLEPDPSDARRRRIGLTRRGREIGDECQRTLAVVEQRWHAQLGSETMVRLRESLEELIFHLDGALPHFPMAMAHRGGTPTGS